MKVVWDIIKAAVGFIQGFGTAFMGLLAILLVVVTVSLSGGRKGPTVPDGGVMVLAPDGVIVEQVAPKDPLAMAFKALDDEPPQVSVHDILDAIEKARDDSRIKAIALYTDGMIGAAPAHLHAIHDALLDFRAADKPVHAISTAYTQGSYLLASAADEVHVNPAGSALITGYSRYGTYFNAMLQKIDASVNVFRVGTYKSGPEPYTRDDMSEAAKQANRAYLTALWRQYAGKVTTARDLPRDRLDKALDALPGGLEAVDGNFALYAQEQGLVDAISPRAVWRTQLTEKYGKSGNGNSFKQIHYRAYLEATRKKQDSDNEIAVITVQGEIVMGRGPITVAAAETVVDQIRAARNNPATRAIVLRVDSPGGSAFASDLIRQELVAAQSGGLPLIASFGPVAASGGYWVSATADEIWARPSTITGSIGVYGVVPTFENTLKKVGISSDGVGTSDLAGAFSVSRPLSDTAKGVIQASIENTYREFLGLVAEGRGMTTEQVDAVAQGRVWIGSDAHRKGLVDRLGDFDDALEAAAAKADVEDWKAVFYRPKPDRFEKLLADLMDSRLMASLLGRADGGALPPASENGLQGGLAATPQKVARFVRSTLDELSAMNDPNGIYARCLACRVQE
ncbi:signal peptide peptidase SppA [Yunchengibacter salinarum]|uniref:signal peptide peptidase SppA n=1 Tax=Yunchengibacter salinarum TaxID=3133399 RepID=UPI0035B58E09